MATKRTAAVRGMTIKSFSISDALWEKLLEQARREEKSASVIIRDLIKEYLRKAKRKEER
jgi:hypothetical protein